ncbi:hypothetical protein [Ligilactobacillus salivarius]|uniref:hypothetical protein n=1 Tax=Ligilactobacillus salivarius TaxID=1624 RepID=UPI0021512F31|nr:hypothetical protein [Ligilactobacillus salivarius]MDH4959879.1 hypothetical protein [Ligilactobacillus salivarius]UUY23247.1 hypothetical protein NUU06_08385 [Ligilactobacillus salivarius]
MGNKQEKTIYVGCPAYNKTGGTELAHQLVNELRNNGMTAVILYYDTDEKNSNEELINPAFRQYVDEYVTLDEVIDDDKNMIIAPEIEIGILDFYHNIKKSIWWMSVDNFVKRNGYINAIKFYGFLGATKAVIKKNIPLFKKKLDNNVLHLYQSEYARLFLKENGINNVFKLSDYLNDTYLDTTDVKKENRDNNVLYNPKKGIEFTNKLIERSPELNWIPIKNMTTEEVRQLLLKSKVYIDFGNHPGKDRFPREAAISGCCIITGKRGSAANNIDICIPEKYKFVDKESNISNIIDQIKECIENYSQEFDNYKEYRQRIGKEKIEFKEDVKGLIDNL